ncbi:hypothetical protein I3271_03155 [Photobacterium leiognathi]|uniref:hypothetical protein n=1 Tax=Photobacterium leiognathi TaxID=553611 RepID=UPI001EDE6A29|nr:hypothetical protein [Photobacterium leiognathi]MCG3883680.1 hypothetical protein [Photobacterium leiognathi]
MTVLDFIEIDKRQQTPSSANSKPSENPVRRFRQTNRLTHSTISIDKLSEAENSHVIAKAIDLPTVLEISDGKVICYTKRDQPGRGVFNVFKNEADFMLISMFITACRVTNTPIGPQIKITVQIYDRRGTGKAVTKKKATVEAIFCALDINDVNKSEITAVNHT